MQLEIIKSFHIELIHPTKHRNIQMIKTTIPNKTIRIKAQKHIGLKTSSFSSLNILFCLLSVILFAACNNQPEQVKEEITGLSDTMLAKATLTKAELQIVNTELKLYGKIQADNNKMSQVYPIVGGNVTKVNVELGDYVKQGQVLAVIRSEEVAGYENQRLDAMNDIAIAEKNLQVAQDLFASKLNSEKDIVVAEKELEKSKASLQRINEVFSIYGLKQGSLYHVTAPISGFVIEKNVTQNMLLHSDNVNNLFSIAQIDDVWVIANVNETEIAAVKQGMNARIKTISYPDRIFTGKVDRIFNILDPQSKTMKVRITIPNTDLALKPGMSVTVILDYKEEQKMSAIPSSAIIFDKNKNWVLVYKDKNDIEIRPVNVYKQNDSVTYVKEGINENENIITGNQLLIYNALSEN